MNRNTLVQRALAVVNSKLLNEEIDHQMSVDREDPGYGLYDALEDAYDCAIDGDDRAMITPARKALIEIGCWREITDEERARTYSSTGKNYDFQLAGKKYVWEKHL